MGDMKEYFKALDEVNARRKSAQALRSLLLLEASGFKFTVLNQNGPHVRVGSFDFWPSTGRFVDRKSNKWGRTIEALLAYLRQGALE